MYLISIQNRKNIYIFFNLGKQMWALKALCRTYRSRSKHNRTKLKCYVANQMTKKLAI